MMDIYEKMADEDKCTFIDLYVRSSNKKAVQVYKNFGYIVYEVLKDYYESEAAYDMHKSLSLDVDSKYMIPVSSPGICT